MVHSTCLGTLGGWCVKPQRTEVEVYDLDYPQSGGGERKHEKGSTYI